MVQDNYGGYMSSDFGQRLMAELGEQTETETEISEVDFPKIENEKGFWRPQLSPVGTS